MAGYKYNIFIYFDKIYQITQGVHLPYFSKAWPSGKDDGLRFVGWVYFKVQDFNLSARSSSFFISFSHKLRVYEDEQSKVKGARRLFLLIKSRQSNMAVDVRTYLVYNGLLDEAWVAKIRPVAERVFESLD